MSRINLQKVRFDLDILAIIYILVICIFTLLVDSCNALVFTVFFLLAIPFYKNIDKLCMVYFVVFSLPDYFVGASNSLFSLQTILVVFLLARFFMNGKVTLRHVLLFLLMIVAVFVSYLVSQFKYINGMYGLMYVILISFLIAKTVKIDSSTLLNLLPKCASVLILFYSLSIVVNSLTSGMITSINSDINHNTFAKSVALLGAIVSAKAYLSEKKRIGSYIISGMAVILLLMSGSRNGLLAMMSTIVFIVMYAMKKRKGTFGKVLLLVTVAMIALLFVSIILPDTPDTATGLLDLSRFNYIQLISSGGTNRVTIWTKVITYVMQSCVIFGYGPGVYCSSQVVSYLVNRTYSGTHNTFIEVFSELGVTGLVIYTAILVSTVKAAKRKLFIDETFIILVALIVNFFVNSIGENMFGRIDSWMIIGFCLTSLPILSSQAKKEGI